METESTEFLNRSGGSGIELDLSVHSETPISGNSDTISEREKVLLFTISSEYFATPIQVCSEIVNLQNCTPVPNMPSFVFGVIHVRGKIVPVIDIGGFLGLASSKRSGNSKVIIVDLELGLVGVFIDTIERVIDMDLNSLQPPLDSVSEDVARYTIGQIELNNSIVVVVDIKTILTCAAIRDLEL